MQALPITAAISGNPLKNSGTPLFFRVDNIGDVGIRAPISQTGDSVRVGVRSLSVMQIEALVLSGRTGAMWRLASDDPVETRVYLDASENGDFARMALDMSEQTCFLQALCKSDLKVKVSIQPYSESGALPAPLPSPDAA
jgi:hypothetical protein